MLTFQIVSIWMDTKARKLGNWRISNKKSFFLVAFLSLNYGDND